MELLTISSLFVTFCYANANKSNGVKSNSERVDKSFIINNNEKVYNITDNNVTNENSFTMASLSSAVETKLNTTKLSFLTNLTNKTHFQVTSKLHSFHDAEVKVENNAFNLTRHVMTTNEAEKDERHQYLEDHRDHPYSNVTEMDSDSFQLWVPVPTKASNQPRRIYRGQRVKIKAFPFMASVHVMGRYQCAGAIIKSDLVITACSCVQLLWNNRFYRENPKVLAVRVGSSFYRGGGELVFTQEVYFHPDYNPSTLAHNLAILRLQRRLVYTRRRVEKISLSRRRYDWNTVKDVLLLGWGARSHANVIKEPWSNRLSYVDLHIYPLSECKKVYNRRYVTSRHFCAGYFSSGSGACNGDAGGPGIVRGRLAGVASFASPVCGTPDSPTVFTSIALYTNWIDNIISMSPPRKKVTVKSDREYDEGWWDLVSGSSSKEQLNTTKILKH